MTPMQLKTPEERSAIAAKSHATRRANKEKLEAERLQDMKYKDSLYIEIARLEAHLDVLRKMETMNIVSCEIIGKALLRHDEIVKASLPWKEASGVYFLIDDDEIVYVGQSINIYSRIPNHWDKKFDRYAYVPCEPAVLDKLESLYIHCLAPKLNKTFNDGSKQAPIALDFLIGNVKKSAQRRYR